MLALALLLVLAPASVDTVFVEAPEIVGTWTFAGDPEPGADQPAPAWVRYGADGLATDADGGPAIRWRTAHVGDKLYVVTTTVWDERWHAADLDGDRLTLLTPATRPPLLAGLDTTCGDITPPRETVWTRER